MRCRFSDIAALFTPVFQHTAKVVVFKYLFAFVVYFLVSFEIRNIACEVIDVFPVAVFQIFWSTRLKLFAFLT